MANLLAPVTRWTYARKLELILAVQSGCLTLGEVTAAHRIGVDEFAQWIANYERCGATGLRSTPEGLRRAG